MPSEITLHNPNFKIELGDVKPDNLWDSSAELAITKQSTAVSKTSDQPDEISYELDHWYLLGHSVTYCLCSSIAIGVIFGESS